MVPDPGADALRSEGPDHEPELQRPEPAPELDPPVPVVVHPALQTGLQVFRHDGEGPDEGLGVPDEVGRAVEVGEHPLVGIEHEGVRVFDPAAHPPELGEDQGRPRVGRIHMEPDVVVPADASDLLQRVNGGGPGGAHGRHHGEGGPAPPAVLFDGTFQFPGDHGVLPVHRDLPEVLPPDSRDHHCLLDGGMGL